MPEIGPVEYMVVAFPGNKFKGEIAPALAELVEKGIVRIIDLAFVMKDKDGNVAAMEIEDMGSDIGKVFQTVQAEIGDLVNEDDLMTIGEGLDPNSSAALLVWEDVWATKFASAVRSAGGELIALERVSRDVVEAAIDFAKSKQ